MCDEYVQCYLLVLVSNSLTYLWFHLMFVKYGLKFKKNVLILVQWADKWREKGLIKVARYNISIF